MDFQKEEKVASKDGQSCFKARYMLAIMITLALALNYCVNVCMSVAIVAMVKTSEHDESTNNQTETDICPGELDFEEHAGEFDWSEETQGYILSSYYYGYVCTQILGGRLAERIGSKHVIGSGILLGGLFSLLIPLGSRTNVYFLMSLRVLQGVVGGVVLPAMHCIFSKWFPPEERAQFSGLIFSALHIGTVIAMSLTGVLADAGGWPLVFYFFGSIGILWYIPWLYVGYNTPNQHPHISDEEKNYINSKLGSVKKVLLPVPWFKILTSPPVWAFFLMHFGYTWETYTLMTELPTYSKNILHFNVRQSGFISALPYLFDWLSSMAAGFLSRWIRTHGFFTQLTTYRIFNGVVVVGGSLCLLAVTIVGCDATVIMILFTITLTTHGFYMAGSAINHMDLAANFAGTIAGMCYTMSNMAGILAPSVVGIIINGKQTLTQWSLVFYIAIGVAIVPYVVYLLLGSVDEQPWNQPKKQNHEESGEIYDKIDSSPSLNLKSQVQHKLLE